MPISFNSSRIGQVYAGGSIKEVYAGSQLVWSSLTDFLNLQTAKASKYRVAFAGSSTMQGWNQPRNESVAHLLTARLLRHVPGANASRMVSQTSGTLAGPTLPGFHFLNAALGGTTSLNYLDTTKSSLVNSYGPDLLIHMVGSNDYIEQVDPDTYKMRMAAALNRLVGSPQHVLVHQQRREDRADTGYTWAQYGEKLRELADQTPNVYFVDVSQTWHELRDGATDWWAADKVHVTWKGAQGLATAIADGLELDEHIGETIWAFDATTMPLANPTLSVQPTSDSLVQLPAVAPSSSVAPGVFTADKGNRLSFNIEGLRHADTATWGEAYSFPITFYVVQEAFGSTGTQVQPWFSRSVLPDDGWWWAWRDKNTSEVRAALNSAFSGAVNYSSSMPLVIAVHMTANNRGTIFVNSESPIGYLDPDRIDANPGPWMKSLRLNANSSLANYGGHSMYEMRFEQSGASMQSVQQRMRQLAEKYGVTLDEEGSGGGKLNTGTRELASVTATSGIWAVLDSFQVPSDHSYTVNAAVTVNWESISFLSSHAYKIRLLCNGMVLAEEPNRPSISNPVQTINQTVTIPAGATVLLQAFSGASSASQRTISGGSWSLAEP